MGSLDGLSSVLPELSNLGSSVLASANLTETYTSVNGQSRSYLWSTPADYDPEEPVPVIFVFPGWGRSEEEMARTAGLNNADALLVYPRGIAQAWAPAPYAETTGSEDLAFIRTILAELDDDFAVDSAQIFATGLSNGGGFAAYLGCQLPGTFAAVAPVAAAYYEGVQTDCLDIPIATLDIHGTADDIMSYNGGERNDATYESVPGVLEKLAVRNNCSDSSTKTISRSVKEKTWSGCSQSLKHIQMVSGGHEWPSLATEEILEFFGV
ncbi:alpha/beta hydrolase family esterase [Corynebacterium alimapuense]|uniref:alpha/beta hydrolase family esterase n=1 Tax=Corynebacterium alimapuense TaxID=1576874 RepID=UPI001403924C|nr:feruloyl esterase [Corynebacterium alimapuense]